MKNVVRNSKGQFCSTNKFNLDLFVNGYNAVDSLGNVVEFSAFDNNNPEKMVVLTGSRKGYSKLKAPEHRVQFKLYKNGRKYRGTTTVWDLVKMIKK